MASINVGEVGTQMLNAALPILSQGGSSVKDYAEAEFKKIALQLEVIAKQTASGAITPEGAVALLQMQLNSSKIVLQTLEGLSLIIVEKAINAALDVVKTAINSLLGFALIA